MCRYNVIYNKVVYSFAKIVKNGDLHHVLCKKVKNKTSNGLKGAI